MTLFEYCKDNDRVPKRSNIAIPIPNKGLIFEFFPNLGNIILLLYHIYKKYVSLFLIIALYARKLPQYSRQDKYAVLVPRLHDTQFFPQKSCVSHNNLIQT